MSVRFPAERAEKRRFLLEAVASVRDTLAAYAEEGETLRTLPPASVAALTDSGLFAMKFPAELGGTVTSGLRGIPKPAPMTEPARQSKIHLNDDGSRKFKSILLVQRS